MSTTIFAVSGSLRQGSYNTALLKALESLAPAGVTFDTLTAEELRALPLYDTDLEKSGYPSTATIIKDRIRRADAVLFATPEYNRTIPGGLKNFLDWTTRPYGDNPYAGKPAYVTGASTGAIGSALAQYDLKKVLLYFDARVLGQPEFYCGMAGEKFDATGVLTDEATKGFIAKVYEAFLPFIEAHQK